MRHAFILLVSSFFLSGTANALSDVEDWANVTRIKRRTRLRVTTRDGDVLKCLLSSANDKQLTVLLSPSGPTKVISKEDIAGVRHRPAGATKRVVGTVLGGFFGSLVGGVAGQGLELAFYDCNCDEPGFSGFLYGFALGMAGGAVGGYHLAKGSEKLIYGAPDRTAGSPEPRMELLNESAEYPPPTLERWPSPWPGIIMAPSPAEPGDSLAKQR